MLTKPSDKVRAELLALPPEDEKLARLYELWNEQRGQSELPDRSAEKPECFHFMLGFINLIDVVDGPPFRLRLVGTDLARRLDQETTGKTTEIVRPRIYRDMIERHYIECRRVRAPSLYTVILTEAKQTRSYRPLSLPYGDQSGAVTLIVTGMRYIDRIEDIVRDERFLSG